MCRSRCASALSCISSRTCIRSSVSFFSRLFGQGRQPLRLVAVPRDHVAGDRARGDALLSGRLLHGCQEIQLADVDFAQAGPVGAAARLLQGFSWLRDLGATLVVEFVDPADPMAQRLLAAKRPGSHGDYTRERFEELLRDAFQIERSDTLGSGTRTLYLARPR